MRKLKRVTDLTSEGGTTDIWELVRQGESAEHLGRAPTVKYGDELIFLKPPQFLIQSG
jgi:hypothetical protein